MDNLLAIGISYKTAPVEQREKMAIAESRLPDFLRSLTASGLLSEAAALSTCNRVEIYAAASDPDAAGAFLRRSLGAAPEDASAFFALQEEDAAAHLFRVASGLESIAVGEREILGQIKRSYDAALAAGTTGRMLNVLFQRALRTGKRVRAETGLSEGPTSTANLAVTLAERLFKSLDGRRVLIIGGGKMAELSASLFRRREGISLTVLNRTLETARQLASKFGAQAAPYEAILEEVSAADVVLSSTGAPHCILTEDGVSRAMDRRSGRPLLIVDLAVPRDVEPGAGRIPGVHLFDIDDLEVVVQENRERRRSEIGRAEVIAAGETLEFAAWLRAARENSPGNAPRVFPPVMSGIN